MIAHPRHPPNSFCAKPIEDEIRQCEGQRDFGRAFVQLARSVHQQNDRRAALKRGINDLLGSDLKEEKSYQTGD